MFAIAADGADHDYQLLSAYVALGCGVLAVLLAMASLCHRRMRAASSTMASSVSQLRLPLNIQANSHTEDGMSNLLDGSERTRLLPTVPANAFHSILTSIAT